MERDRGVLAQGFTESDLGLSWWTEALDALGVDAGVDFRLVRSRGGEPRLTRAAIMDLSESTFEAGAAPEQLISLMWHVLAWGSGKSRRHNRRRIASLTGTAAAENLELLRHAGLLARDGKASEAYGVLIKTGGGVIPGLGPSFFTKYLYFAGAGQADHRCLILDARVARALHGIGWTELPAGYFNWYRATYESYCALLARWAAEIEQQLGRAVAADEIEYVLFRGANYFYARDASPMPSWVGQPESV